MAVTIRSAASAAAILVGCGLVALLTPPAAGAQPAARIYRVGFMASGTATASAGMVEALREGLRELGWVEGRNIVVDYRFAEGRFDRLPDLAAEFVRQRMDLIVAAPTPAALAARNASTAIPIVMANVADPVGLGLVASLARPGGNVTGLSYSVDFDIFGKQLQLLKEAVPGARRIAVLSNPANPGHARAVSRVKAAAPSAGVSLQFLEARAVEELDGALAAMVRDHAEALLVVSDSLFGSHAPRLAALAARSRLPSMHGARSNVYEGGLMFYGPNLVHQLRQAAAYVDKILKGARPADLPVEQPTTFELIVNLKTAKTLGLTIPPSLRLRADRVIE